MKKLGSSAKSAWKTLPLQPRKLLGGLGLIRAISHWLSDRQLRRWKRANPTGTHAEFYAAMIDDKLSHGKPHATLGSRRQGAGHKSAEWTPNTFSKRGLDLWEEFVGFGLTPALRCVDYGCGSLRLGQHAIRYLDPGNYFGIDVTESFIDHGKKLIGEDLLLSKQPRFGVLNERVIDEIGRWKPNFVFSNAVLTHIPQNELDLYFQRLEAMMTSDTQAFVTFVAAPRRKRLRAMTWAYPFDELQSLAQAAAPSLRLELGDVEPGLSRARGGRRQVLRIVKKDAAKHRRSADR